LAIEFVITEFDHKDALKLSEEISKELQTIVVFEKESGVVKVKDFKISIPERDVIIKADNTSEYKIALEILKRVYEKTEVSSHPMKEAAPAVEIPGSKPIEAKQVVH
jgi:hypothetical protein